MTNTNANNYCELQLNDWLRQRFANKIWRNCSRFVTL